MRLKKYSLQRIFLLPLFVLMLSLAATMSWVLYRASEEATDAISEKILDGMMARTGAMIERHLSNAHVIVNSIAPPAVDSADHNIHVELGMPQDLAALEDRLWIATGLYPHINEDAFYGAEDGRFVGVQRKLSEGLLEVRYRLAGSQQSNVYSMSAPHQQLALLHSDQFDPRKRPWYTAAVKQGGPAWSPVYVDFNRKEPLLTLSKPVYGAGKALLGVVGIDVSMRQLALILQVPKAYHNGIQFIVDGNAELIATSTGDLPFVRVDDANLKRQKVDEASSLMRATYQQVKKNLLQNLAPGVVALGQISSEQGTLQIAAMRLKDDAGLDWVTVTAIPRNALRTEVSAVTLGSFILGLLMIVLTLVLAYTMLRKTLGDIRTLTRAVQHVSTGEPMEQFDLRRNDEIGMLADSFQEMEKNLRTDGLTHLLNRDAFVSQVELRRRRSTDMMDAHFALVFISLDDFKDINEQYGHAAGDKILTEIGMRLKNTIRKDDSAARFGGDEFVVYLHAIKGTDILEQLCDKLRLVLELPIDLNHDDIAQVSFSLGAALYPDDGHDMQSLLAVCDKRMLEEKQRYRDEVKAREAGH